MSTPIPLDVVPDPPLSSVPGGAVLAILAAAAAVLAVFAVAFIVRSIARRNKK